MQKLMKRMQDLLKLQKYRKRWSNVVRTLGCLVVFCTVYALILPAITMESHAYCGKEEHIHTEECYSDQLICELEEHEHDTFCYSEPEEAESEMGIVSEVMSVQTEVKTLAANIDAQADENRRIAYFSFDDEGTGFAGDGAKASVMEGGTITIETVDSYRGTGGALKLNGETGLNVTKDDGTSLLTGLTEMTVSCYVKPDTDSKNWWAFYAAANDATQVYQQGETYLGIITQPAWVRAERFMNGRATGETDGDPMGEGWHHVVVTYGETETTVYVDGVRGETSTNEAALTDILGTGSADNTSILRIGKGNYGTGEYYKGLIDNYSIYNYAMTADEVLAIDVVEPVEPVKARIAHFSFDDTIAGLTGDGATATVIGGGEPDIRANGAYSGGAIYLNGSTGLDVKTDEKTSLLTGLTEMTVSFYVKPDTEGENKWWAFYAAPDDSAQISADGRVTNVSIYTDPYYTVANRFYNGAPDAAQNNTGDYEWHHIVAVFESDKTTLYVDGQPGTPVASGHTLPSILGNDSIVQIGKGNWQDEYWPNGEFFKGYLDEYSIYNYAMTPEEVLALEKVKPARERIAYFDFDDAATGLKGNGATAKVMGGAAPDIRTTAEAYLQGSIYLDGATGLNVTKDDGTSLLTGLSELTVSFYAKPENNVTANGWAFYASPNADTQQYLYERYLGIISTTTTGTAERFNNAGARADSPEGAINADARDDGWFHVAVVYETGKTTLYVNGVQVDDATSTYSISELLGDNSILQIGKANWGAGEYFKGYLDEYSIYNYALTPEEVLKLAPVKERIAYFSFDTNYTDGQGATATAEGTPAITTSKMEAYLGNALHITGTSSLNVTSADNSSLLTGVREMTVSFYAKPQNCTNYWAFYAAPDKATQVYERSENYIGILSDPTWIRAERFKENRYTAASAEVSYSEDVVFGNGWHHIVVVYEVDSMTVYVDGQKGQSIANGESDKELVTISELLKDNSILQIGKGNYGNGEYFQGFIDEYSIYNYALTDEEVLNLEPEAMRVKKAEPIAYFDFDDATIGTVAQNPNSQVTGDGAIAKTLNGNPTITNEDSYNGRSLKLNGSSAIKVTDENGKPLLTGLDEMTVSYYSLMNISGADFKWTVFASDTDITPTDATANYVGIRDRLSGNVESERFSGGKTASGEDLAVASVVAEPIWRHVVVTFGRDATKIYIDGTLMTTNNTMYNSIRNILGENSILQIGKGNWGGGEYYLGYIDELAIYNHAMTDAEVAALEHRTYEEVVLNFANSINGAMGSTHYKNLTIDGMRMDNNWAENDGEGRRLDIPVNFDEKGNATITLPDNAALTAGFTVADGDIRHTVTQDASKYQWKLVGWYNIGTGQHYDLTHGPVTVDVSSANKNVFYADWEPVSYDYGSPQDAVLEIKTGADAYLNGSAYLDGATSLNVTKADGTSLLTGLTEMTVSFYVKPDTDSTTFWAFYAAPDSRTQISDNTEVYLGVMADPTNVFSERFYYGRENGTANGSAMGDGWHHVVAVFGETESTVYVDGVAGETTTGQSSITDILGNASILQIGKANWGTGEFLKGYIDEYSIYNYAMTAEEVLALEQKPAEGRIAYFNFDNTITGFAGDGAIAKVSGLANTVDTSSFVEMHMFDYNELFGISSAIVKQSGTSSELWTAHLLDDGSITMVDDADEENTWQYGSLANAWDRTEKNVYSGTVPYPDIVDSKEHPLIKNMFSPDTTAMGVDYVGPANFLFSYDDTTKTYSYNSETNAAVYNQTDKRFYVYDSPQYHHTAWDGYVTGMLPYNEYDPSFSGNTASSDIYYNNGSTNYWFGMSAELQFFLPDNSGTEGANQVAENDMTFYFSGDDDVWVFVDNQLVLDLGGIHHRINGNINFSTGEVTVTQSDGAAVSTKTSSFKAGSHTLTIYYMERGGNESNCQISFNILPSWEINPPTVNTVTAKKVWQNIDEAGLQKKNIAGASVGLLVDGIPDPNSVVLLNKSNNWQYTWEGLEVYQADGVTKHTYEVYEASNLEGFEVTSSYETGETYPYWAHIDVGNLSTGYKVVLSNGMEGAAYDDDGNVVSLGKVLGRKVEEDGSITLEQQAVTIKNDVIFTNTVQESAQWVVQFSADASQSDFFYLKTSAAADAKYLSIKAGAIALVDSADTASLFRIAANGDLNDSTSDYRLSVNAVNGEVIVSEKSGSSESTEEAVDRVHICGYETLSSTVYEYTVTNTYIPDITVTKTNVYTGEIVPGAQFYLYKLNPNRTNSYYYYNEETGSVEWHDLQLDYTIYTTDENGQIVFKEMEPGTYYLHEVSAPGYEPLKQDVSFTFENGEITSVNGPEDYVEFDTTTNTMAFIVKNEPTVPVRFQKVSVTKEGEFGTAVTGAKFELYGSDSIEAGAVKEGAAPIAALTSDAEGYMTIQNLSKGTYYLKEIEAPEGYKLLHELIEITVAVNIMDETTGEYEMVVTMTEPSKFGDLDLDYEKEGTVDGVTTYTVKVPNELGYRLPDSGSTGTLPYTFGGALLMCAGLLYGYSMRRKRERRVSR